MSNKKEDFEGFLEEVLAYAINYTFISSVDSTHLYRIKEFYKYELEYFNDYDVISITLMGKNGLTVNVQIKQFAPIINSGQNIHIELPKEFDFGLGISENDTLSLQNTLNSKPNFTVSDLFN